MTLENDRAPLPCHFVLCIISYPLVNSNWSYSPQTPKLGQNRRYFCGIWPWNLTDDLGKQWDNTPTPHRALRIMSLPNVSYDPETAKLSFGVCDLDLWPLNFSPFVWTSLLSMVIISENLMMSRWEKHCEMGVTDWWTNRYMGGRTESSNRLTTTRAFVHYAVIENYHHYDAYCTFIKKLPSVA